VDAVPHAEENARVRSADFTERDKLFGENAVAVDVWISPEQLVTEYIARLIRYPGALQVLDFADGRVRLVGIRALQGGPLVGQALRTLREHIPRRTPESPPFIGPARASSRRAIP